MSMMRSVEKLTKTLMPPPVPAGTMAAFARIEPAPKFSVETTGFGAPVGQTVRYPPGGVVGGETTVKFNE